jgi:internalin A
LVSPPREVQAQGIEAVLAFLRALAESSVKRWRSKILIVGEATVGKTSLAKRLLGEAFDPDERQTHGVRVRSLAMPHPDRVLAENPIHAAHAAC